MTNFISRLFSHSTIYESTFKGHLDKPCNFSHCKIDKVLSCSDSYMLERSPLAVTAASNRSCKGPFTFITQISTRIDCFWFKTNQANWRIVKNIIKSQFFSTTDIYVRRLLKGKEPISWFALPTDQLWIFSYQEIYLVLSPLHNVKL